jgi:hypothetical protein
MRRSARRADFDCVGVRVRLDLDDGGHMDPVQTKLLLLMMLISLLFAAQALTQGGGVAALP